MRDRKSNNPPKNFNCVVLRSSDRRAGILTGCPSASPFGYALGPPNPWMIIIAKETLGFRCQGLSP